MRMALETYGKAIVSCIISVFIFSFLVLLMQSYYEKVYPDHNTSSITPIYEDTISASGPPIIDVPKELKIKRGDTSYDAKSYADDKTNPNYISAWNKYKTFATAYQSDIDTEEIQVEVYGFDEIDVNNVGKIYTLMFKATNKNGHTTTRTSYVLIN